MNRFNLILIVFLASVLLASVVMAETDDTVSSDETAGDADELDDTNEPDEGIELEESDEETLSADDAPKKAFIRTLFFSGTGIASNPSDAMDFYTVKVVGGKVALPDRNIVGRGILYLDEEKYRLTDLNLVGDTATANIVSFADTNTDTNNFTGTVVGSLSLTKVAKPSADVWAGTMTLNSKPYNFYLLAQKRMFKASEIAEKAKNYCKENPFDESCKSVAGYLCNDNPKECREKVERYCEDHPGDSRCKEIVRSYCAGNLRDARCREEMKDYCEKFPNTKYCESDVVEFCKENPEDTNCQNVFAEYCKTHEKDSRCKAAEISFCKKNPSAENCAPIIKQFCEYNQTAELCGTTRIGFCEKNPDDPKCAVTATALCKLDRFKDTEKCTAIVSAVQERVRKAASTTNRVNQ